MLMSATIIEIPKTRPQGQTVGSQVETCPVLAWMREDPVVACAARKRFLSDFARLPERGLLYFRRIFD
ncbi:hypothetical protein WS62_16130 [Burkholderia sp. ABCPW 14]|nr:hypothetical protein WS62_16130 [Burkholderia sp. ABCPW 14]